ncbi:MAG: helix-turn-helix domain-containing protein [Bdellovibrionales bacterium]
MLDLNFSLNEIFSFIGLFQCVYVIVYIAFRSGQILRAGLPLAYFAVLACAFFFDLAQHRIGGFSDYYFYLQWAAWFSGPPLSVLLVIQFANMNKKPEIRDLWILGLLPLCFILSVFAVQTTQGCGRLQPCEELKSLLIVTGLMAGAISLLVIFSKKDVFTNIRNQKFGKERYWLIMMLIVVNIVFLCLMMAELSEAVNGQQALLLRTILGLGFVYLVNTSMFRLFPVAEKRSDKSSNSDDVLSTEEQLLAQKIENLILVEKVYQEVTYSRSDLARECDVPETVVSRVINVHFQKSFPQLMNELRIDDAKNLLSETNAPIKVIAQEAGFNSLPSFNRVFKDMTGESPSEFRKKSKS